ncbi:n-acetyltransferase 10 [Chrysochromulina tobinii]|uniref:RNA cytidine acetyltransferase n=1 Tax=Chrysochromulina tobinii TaxID=1460289 RepID=A0A0M0JF84_9EUKA|nr:n-acetyltransferase 10 [Chrysochromulina tobinii]|eukprot:KOO25261.1 n-acetyltransferase 10 [Chrysochromulina sp. CCMP291]
MRKKVDSRVRTLIENGVKLRHRSLFIIVGDAGREQVVNLHYMLSKAVVKARPSVLWCYKKDLGFTTHRKKRMRQIKKMIQRGLLDPDKDDPFELFISSTDISYCYYKETQRVLGNTFGMLVLQDFEAVTPNVLARTVETVEGGGIVVLLLKSMSSLKQLYAMSMDVHARYRTEAHSDIQPRFNERFILSLASCAACLVLDDELNVLPISTHSRAIKPIAAPDEGAGGSASGAVAMVGGSKGGVFESRELRALKESLRDTQPVGAIISKVATLDQAKAVLSFVEAAGEKSLRTTVALTAARGRGKSAALGLSLAAAIAYGYANIFVTSPSPENLRTLFEFVLKGFDALEYKEHIDFTVVESTNPELKKAVVRINVFHQHRQTIQYIEPTDAQLLSQAELLVVDEAAAIPIPQAASHVPSVSGCPHPSDCELYWVDRDALFSYHSASEAFLQRMVALFVASHYKNTPNDLQLMSDAPAHQLFALLGPVDVNATRLPDVLAVVQTVNETTGEHTAIVVRALGGADEGVASQGEWARQYAGDFRRRLTSLLGLAMSKMGVDLALSLLAPDLQPAEDGQPAAPTAEQLQFLLGSYDMRRLHSYAHNLVDHHLVMDLVPLLASLRFTNRLRTPLSHVQAAILLGLGLQHKTLEELAAELGLPASQLLALFNKAVRRMVSTLRAVEEAAEGASLPDAALADAAGSALRPMKTKLSDEMDAGAAASLRALQAEQAQRQAAWLKDEGKELSRYAIKGSEAEWAAALGGAGVPRSVSVKSAGRDAAAESGGGVPVKTAKGKDKDDSKRPRRDDGKPSKRPKTA